ncbi:MAG: DNA gyrase subunit A [bacterium]
MSLLEEQIIVDIEDEMKNSYLDYAMSVIIGRALPDIRDGLKPVHRRILYAMHELGLLWNKPFRKSARLVGEVLGKYHPHGEASVYDAICRMVQNFSLRYPLINGQGNFGSIDGDSPAAMRYTEVKLERITQEFLKDIDKETVDFVKNFDESLEEPLVLPTPVPNLLINGSSGIAVGMATNIPPHNLNEVINGLIFLIDNPDSPIEQLMKFIQGPDFPTAGIIHGRKGILEAYTTGKGIIKLRAKAEIERDSKTDRDRIIIYQIPYQVNKAKLLEKIAELINEKKIEGISDLRDESDREGMRIVIELKKNEIAQATLNFLYKHTPLETSFGITMLALVNNQPRILNLKEILQIFILYRKEIIIRRTTFELRQAEEKLHILEGLKKALDHIDRVIEIIRSSKTVEQARETLMGEFSLSALQAKSILEMRLQKLTGMEREELENDLKNLYEKIAYFRKVLAEDHLIMNIIKDELLNLQNIYKDNRLTQIVDHEDEISYEDMLTEQEMVVIITHRGYIKRTSLDQYKIQKRAGCGVRGVLTSDEDFTAHLFVTTTHNSIFFFTDTGRVFCLKIFEIPETGRSAKGTPIVNLLPLLPDEKIAASFTFKELQEGQYLVMATKKGLVKKTCAEEFKNIERFGNRGIRGLIIGEDDRLVQVKMTNGNQDILLGTRGGQAIRFNEKQVRISGRVSQGVKGIKLEKNDEVVAALILNGDSSILTVTEKGFGKRTSVDEYVLQNRGGKGLKNIKLTSKNGHVVGIREVLPEETLMIITLRGKVIWMRINDLSRDMGRNTQGLKLIELDDDDRVVSIDSFTESSEKE